MSKNFRLFLVSIYPFSTSELFCSYIRGYCGWRVSGPAAGCLHLKTAGGAAGERPRPPGGRASGPSEQQLYCRPRCWPAKVPAGVGRRLATALRHVPGGTDGPALYGVCAETAAGTVGCAGGLDGLRLRWTALRAVME